MAVLVAFASCSKKLSIDPLSFAVTTKSATYNVGDTVNFNFTGNPDIISFYSGLPGNTYDTTSLISANVGVPLKNITQVLSSYSYVYKVSGSYKVVFVATNATADAQQSNTKEIDLTIQ
jgi:hypothetical protein